MADAQKFGEFDLGEAEFDATQGAEAKDLERLIGQLAGVRQLDRHGDPPSRGLASPLSLIQSQY